MSDKQLRTLRAKIKQDRDAAYKAALTLADRAGDPVADADLEFALGRVDQLEQRLDRLPKPKAQVREPDLYAKGSPHSFFRDLVATVSPVPVRGVDPLGATDRLQRHAEYERTRRIGEAQIRTGVLSGMGIEVRTAQDGLQQRAISTAAGAGGEFVPPKWLLDEFASVSRAAAPLARIVPSLPLPAGTLELHVPRFTASAGVVAESAQNTDPGPEYSTTDGIVTPVVTFAADAQISQQLLDRSPGFDGIVQRDLAEAYAAALELQLIDGTGTGGQMLGLLNVSGVETVTWTSTAPTPTAFVTQCGLTAAGVSKTRARPPSCLIMRPGRYFWSAAQPDGSGNENAQRPGTGLIAKDSDTGPVGPVAGLPVYLDAAIPATINSSQDAVLAVRTADLLLLEDEPRYQVVVEQGAASLSVAIVMHRYASFIANRYPSAIGVLTGTGLAVPAGW